MWTLPPEDNDYSKRIGRIKALFTKIFRPQAVENLGDYAAVWQPRFWEHAVRNEEDRNRLLDYIHFNPVKHGYAMCPHVWKHTSFHRFVRRKVYDATWCCSCSGRMMKPPDFADLAPYVGE